MHQRPIARYFSLIFAILLGTAVILVGISMVQESAIDLRIANKTAGKINNRKIGKYFAFTLANSPTTFNVYRANRSYNDLQSLLAVGDSVTVYSINSATANLQVAQVEKGREIIVDKQLLQGQNRVGGIIALFGGLTMAGVAVWQFRRGRIL